MNTFFIFFDLSFSFIQFCSIILFLLSSRFSRVPRKVGLRKYLGGENLKMWHNGRFEGAEFIFEVIWPKTPKVLEGEEGAKLKIFMWGVKMCVFWYYFDWNPQRALWGEGEIQNFQNLHVAYENLPMFLASLKSFLKLFWSKTRTKLQWSGGEAQNSLNSCVRLR